MAVRISRGLLLSASAHSSTPFLFQTRTLAPLSQLHRSFTRGVQQYSRENHAWDKYDSHESNASTKPGDRSSESSLEESASNITAEQSFTRRSYLRKRGVAISQAKVQNRDQPSPLKPLETTTSYAQSTEISSNKFSVAPSGLSCDSHTESTSSPLAKDAPASSRSFIRKRASSITRSKPPRTKQPSSPSSSKSKPLPTMTPHEKLIFADLLGQLDIKRGANPAKTGGDPGKQAEQSPSGRGNLESINELVAMFDSILGDAQEKEKPAPVTKTESKPSEESSASADVLNDSHKIRLSELGFSEPASGSREETMITVEEAVEIVVKREAKKVEFELFQAIEEGKGDIGLWDVCKERIFTMLQHLDETLATQPSLAGFLPDTLPTTETEQPASKTSSGSLNIPDIVPISPVVVKLYPKTLLIAFRLLNTHFPDSQLLSQFRTAIQAQGRSSAVLGTSTALFEEMIYFYWHGCHDLPAVVSFLRDMELHGLNMSDKSRTLLKEIVRERYRDLKAARASGEQDDPFWDLPPNRKAFEELAAPGGWLDRMKKFAVPRHRTSGSAQTRR